MEKKHRLNKVLGISHNNAYKVRRVLSSADMYLDKVIVQRFQVEELEGKDHMIAGYKISQFYRDVDDPNWKNTPLKPVGFGLITTRRNDLEEALAGIVPDETYEGNVMVEFHWVD